jgi:hypothetical protein
MTAHHPSLLDNPFLSRRKPVIGFRCDAGGKHGVGHLIRCVALAEELAERSHDVVFLSDPGDSSWAAAQLDSRNFKRYIPPPRRYRIGPKCSKSRL